MNSLQETKYFTCLHNKLNHQKLVLKHIGLYSTIIKDKNTFNPIMMAHSLQRYIKKYYSQYCTSIQNLSILIQNKQYNKPMMYSLISQTKGHGWDISIHIIKLCDKNR